MSIMTILYKPIKGATIQCPEGGLEFLSRENYWFQPGSAARRKFHILLNVYIIERFWK